MPGAGVWVTTESKWTGTFVASYIQLKFPERVTAAGCNVIVIIPGQFQRMLKKGVSSGFLLFWSKVIRLIFFKKMYADLDLLLPFH
ncbi:hypothetical protein AC068_02740 [Morganella morganii]|nr:hypothetical protein AC068_02740 [Morganella morganii]